MSPSSTRRLLNKLSLAAAIGLVFALIATAVPASAAVVSSTDYYIGFHNFPNQAVSSQDSRYVYAVTDHYSQVGDLTVLDLVAGQFVATIPLGHQHAQGVALSPDGTTLYVSLGGDVAGQDPGGIAAVDVQDPQHPAITAFLPISYDASSCLSPGQQVSVNPTSLVINASGSHLYVIGRDTNMVYDIDLTHLGHGGSAIVQTAEFAPDFICTGWPQLLNQIALSADGTTLFVTSSSTQLAPPLSHVYALDTSQFPAGRLGNPGSGVFPELTLPSGSQFNNPTAVATSPDGSSVFIADTQEYSGGVPIHGDNTVWVFDQNTSTLSSSFDVTDTTETLNSNSWLTVSPDSSQLVVNDAEGYPAVTLVSTATHSTTLTEHLTSASPTHSTAFSADGAHLITAWFGDFSIYVTDLNPAYPYVPPVKPPVTPEALAATGFNTPLIAAFALLSALAGGLFLGQSRNRARARARMSSRRD